MSARVEVVSSLMCVFPHSYITNNKHRNRLVHPVDDCSTMMVRDKREWEGINEKKKVF